MCCNIVAVICHKNAVAVVPNSKIYLPLFSSQLLRTVIEQRKREFFWVKLVNNVSLYD